MAGDPGGVAEGLWVGPRAGILTLDIGELLGLLDKLAFRLERDTIYKNVLLLQ